MASSNVKIIDLSAQWMKNFEKDQVKKLHRAAIFLKNEIKKILRTKYPPASNPGEPPHLRTGELGRSIAHTVDEGKLIARVGSNKDYAGFLERGTSEMEKRELFAASLDKHAKTVAKILGSK